jgi:hypothetical protein
VEIAITNQKQKAVLSQKSTQIPDLSKKERTFQKPQENPKSRENETLARGLKRLKVDRNFNPKFFRQNFQYDY